MTDTPTKAGAESPAAPLFCCPFCGGTATWIVGLPLDSRQVECKTCCARGPIRRTDIQAYEAWCNRQNTGISGER